MIKLCTMTQRFTCSAALVLSGPWSDRGWSHISSSANREVSTSDTVDMDVSTCSCNDSFWSRNSLNSFVCCRIWSIMEMMRFWETFVHILVRLSWANQSSGHESDLGQRRTYNPVIGNPVPNIYNYFMNYTIKQASYMYIMYYMFL